MILNYKMRIIAVPSSEGLVGLSDPRRVLWTVPGIYLVLKNIAIIFIIEYYVRGTVLNILLVLYH